MHTLNTNHFQALNINLNLQTNKDPGNIIICRPSPERRLQADLLGKLINLQCQRFISTIDGRKQPKKKTF